MGEASVSRKRGVSMHGQGGLGAMRGRGELSRRSTWSTLIRQIMQGLIWRLLGHVCFLPLPLYGGFQILRSPVKQRLPHLLCGV